mgnify:CR=1 FL=1
MRRILAVFALALAMPAQAQSVRAYTPPPTTKKPAYRLAQPYNSMAKDTTPFNCEQYRGHPHPGMETFCRDIENMTLQNEARMQGRPAASKSVVRLPASGTPEARQLGYACIGGQAFKRLKNGWEQVGSAGGGWQRCVGG